MEAEGDRVLHQVVVGGVVLDLVDPVPVPVEGTEHRRMGLGQSPPVLGFGAAGQAADHVELVLGPPGALPVERLEQRRAVGGVEVDQWRSLIGDDMGVGHEGSSSVAGESGQLRRCRARIGPAMGR
jgi:hypothetical protein